MKFSSALSLLACFASTLHAQEIFEPRVMQAAEITVAPFTHNGMMRVGNFVGSGSRIAEGIISTAGHVFLDEANETWFPASSISYFPQRMSSFSPPASTEQRYFPTGFVRFESYATRVIRENSPGVSTRDTFNLDLAIAYFGLEFVITAGFQLHAEVTVRELDSVSMFRDDGRQKMLVGYPQRDGSIPANDQGFMHQTGPSNFEIFWTGSHSVPSTWRDSEDFWVTTYSVPDMRSYSGNSGGPFYVQGDDGQWVQGAVLVGGGENTGALLRGIDEEAWALVEAAQDILNRSTLRRVLDLQAPVVESQAVSLAWTDRSATEVGFSVFRRDHGPWIKVADLDPNSTTFVDSTVHPGRVYSYEIQPFDARGNRVPRSNRVRVQTPGVDREIARSLNLTGFHLRHLGDANWFSDPLNRLRAGDIVSMEASQLELHLVGPGTLAFEWGVSSEENIDDRGIGDDIYDALFLEVSGPSGMTNALGDYLSGEIPQRTKSLNLPAGGHRIVWSYEKDPYASEGLDTGFLHSITWTPDPQSGDQIIGAFDIAGTPNHAATWFGEYYQALGPWILHPELGWMKAARAANGQILQTFLDGIGPVYTLPDLFPYLFRFSDRKWLYYERGSGRFGRNARFHDLSSGNIFESNPL